MTRRAPRVHNLKRPKIRQDWNKYNLYNLFRARIPNVGPKTYFQQKWASKAATRAYHGEQVNEKYWQRMFNRRIPAVVPMDAKYLALHDGSEQAAGRGSGQDKATVEKADQLRMTPYMQNVYFPLERRLDTSIFRALFASSARQARQLVLHGAVTVNGKKMKFPGYLLNPGDMFQVNPDRVMTCTGQPKGKTGKEIKFDPSQFNSETSSSSKSSTAPTSEPEAPEAEAADTTPENKPQLKRTVEEFAATNVTELQTKDHLRTLLKSATVILGPSRNELSGRKKQAMRLFRKELTSVLSKKWPTDPETPAAQVYAKSLQDLFTHFEALKVRLFPPSFSKTVKLSEDSPEELTKEQEKLLQEALTRARENPIDPSKPYLTPWRPRDYMSAFAFIPRYLEVNQNICAAVYLRHPVVRPGLAEVPSPFAMETNQLAFNWYLRRR